MAFFFFFWHHVGKGSHHEMLFVQMKWKRKRVTRCHHLLLLLIGRILFVCFNSLSILFIYRYDCQCSADLFSWYGFLLNQIEEILLDSIQYVIPFTSSFCPLTLIFNNLWKHQSSLLPSATRSTVFFHSATVLSPPYPFYCSSAGLSPFPSQPITSCLLPPETALSAQCKC